MKFTLVLPLIGAATLALGGGQLLDYPVAKTDGCIENYHGTKVADPYRWLEDTESADTRAWVAAENKITHTYLSELAEREEIKKRLTELWNFDKLVPPDHRGKGYFFTRLKGLQNQKVLYVADNPAGVGARVLVDTNASVKESTVSLAGFEPSEDGEILAYGLGTSGSDWVEWHFKRVETGEDLPDKLLWSKFGGVSFTADGGGVFYGRYPESTNKLKDVNYNQALYFHKFGQLQKNDVLIADNPAEKEWSFHGAVTEDGRYLVVQVYRNTNPENLVYYKDLSMADAPLTHLIDDWDGEFSYFTNEGSVFYFKTTRNAPKGRIVAIDLNRPSATNWKEVIPQSANILQEATRAANSILVSYLVDARSELKLFNLNGSGRRDVPLPGIGTAGRLFSHQNDKNVFFNFSSFNTPPAVYKLDVPAASTELVLRPTVAFEPSDFVTTQVFLPSNDGTKIPMFLIRHKNLDFKAGPHPVFLYAYGGFNASITPWFRPDLIAWMEKGGICAIPNLRGGGEYGEEWHRAGMKEKKQNVFDDFISAARWLIAEKYTTSSLLAINGASNGGLLIGASLTQQPRLFAVAVPEVGVLDMLRYHKFTIGHAWTGEYGSADNAADFAYLLKYSPLHNVREDLYPATLILTGDHDDRVFPAHSFKFAAALQSAQRGQSPILIRVETNTGHGHGKPTDKQIDEAADKWAFIFHNTHLSEPVRK